MKDGLKKTALIAGLVCTWDVPAEGYVHHFEGSITPTQTLSHVYFLYSTGTCNNEVYFHEIAPTAPAGIATPVSFDLDTSVPAGMSYLGDLQVICALYNDASNGVTISYNTAAANKVLAQSPAPQWVGGYLPAYLEDTDTVGTEWVGETEIQMADLIRTGHFDRWETPPGLDSVSFFWDYPPLSPPRFANNATDPNFTLVNFSAASDGGGAFIQQVVPEPVGGALLAATAAYIAGRRKRR